MGAMGASSMELAVLKAKLDGALHSVICLSSSHGRGMELDVLRSLPTKMIQ